MIEANQFYQVAIEHEGFKIVAKHMGSIYEPKGSFTQSRGTGMYVYSLPENLQNEESNQNYFCLVFNDRDYKGIFLNKMPSNSRIPFSVMLDGKIMEKRDVVIDDITLIALRDSLLSPSGTLTGLKEELRSCINSITDLILRRD